MPPQDDLGPYGYNTSFDDFGDYLHFRLEEVAAQNQMMHNMRIQGVRDTHFIQNIGKYVTPSSNTWEAYSSAVRACGMDFDANGYAFDKEVAHASGNRALYDPSARHYTDYEPLRHNLSVLRNYMLNHIYGEEIDAQESISQQKFAYVLQIGHAVGEMLRRGNNPLLANPLAPSVSPKSANVEYDGAVAIYKKLRNTQRSNKIMAPVNFITHLDLPHHMDRDWRLPPIEITPFGKMNFYAPPPADSIAMSDPIIVEPHATLQADALRNEMAHTMEMDALGTAFANTGIGYNTVESLSQPIKIQAIEIAREILEKLKIQFSSTPVMAMLDYNSGQFDRTITDLNSIIAVYKDHLQRAVMLDPSLVKDPMILNAGEAIGFLGAQIKLKALDRAEMIGDTEHSDLIRHELQQLPQHWLNPNRMNSIAALSALEQGLSMVVATLAMMQEEAMGQNQRGLMLDASIDSPQEQSRRLQSLAYDEQFQKIAAERRTAFIGAGGHKPAQTKHHLGMPANAVIGGLPEGASQSKKHGRDLQVTSSVTVGSVFDNLLTQYGASAQQMQSSINAPTSGNFSVAAPGSAQQVIQQVIAHRSQSGQHGTKATQREKARQRQQKEKQLVAHQKQHTMQKEAARQRDDDTPDDDTPGFTGGRRSLNTPTR